MGIFSYGRVYSKLTPKQLVDVKVGIHANELLLKFAQIYFWLFGYPDIASQRRYVMVEKLLKLRKGEVLLDAGCGNGIYLQEFGNKFGIKGVGIDVRKERIVSAIKINKSLKRKDVFITSSLENAKLGKWKFDKAICLEVLEHIVDDAGVLKLLSKNIIKGGLFVVSIPMIGTALTKEQENDPFFKPQKYEHVRSGYTKKTIKQMAHKAGLKIVLIEEYFFAVSRVMVKIQQFIYMRNWTILNLILSPILNVISTLDNFIKLNPRGYLIVLIKR